MVSVVDQPPATVVPVVARPPATLIQIPPLLVKCHPIDLAGAEDYRCLPQKVG